MRLYRLELYKLWHRKLFGLGIVIVMALLILWFFVSVVGEEFAYVDGKNYERLDAIRKNREITREFEGVMTDEKAEAIIKKYGFPSEVKEYYGKYRDSNYLTSFVTDVMSDGYFYSWDNYKLPTTLYPMKDTVLAKVSEKAGEPFSLTYCRGWLVLLDALQMGFIFCSLFLLICLAKVFAQEREKKMLPLMFTTEYGKERGARAKIAAAFSVALAVYLVMVLFVTVLVYVVYGLDGADMAAGIVFNNIETLRLDNPWFVAMWLPMWKYTGIYLGCCLLAMLGVCALVLWLSARTNTTFLCVAASVVCWLLPVFLLITFGRRLFLYLSAMPVLLVMYSQVQDVYAVLYIPIAIAVVLLVVEVVTGYRRYLAL